MNCSRILDLLSIAVVAFAFTGCDGELNFLDGSDSLVGPDNPNNANNANNPNNDDGSEIGEPTPDTFVCEPGFEAPEQPMRRLTMEQYRYTVRDLLEMVGPTGDEVADDIGDQINRMPEDAPRGSANDTHGGYRRLDQALQQNHVDISLDVAVATGEAFTQNDDRLEDLMGTCATDGATDNDFACVDDFIRDFGALVLRRTLTDDDVAFYHDVYDADGIDEAGIRDVVSVMMTSPRFLYMVEHGGEAAESPNTYRLEAHELASRLSLHFWQSMPDRALLEKAEDGSLLDPAVYEAEVDRVFADPKTERSVTRFMQDWLWADEIPEMNSLLGTAAFDTFVGDNTPTDDLREHMIDELIELGKYYMLTNPASFQEMFASPHSFATADELAAIYGVETWDGQSEPPRFNEVERTGLYTRAAFLSTGTTSTRPIMKGYFVRKNLLCTTPPPPDEAAANAELDITDDMTTREVVEELTEQPGTSCAGCHLTYLNDLGFPTENFDGMGRFRSEEMLFDDEGTLYGSKAVDTSANPQVRIGEISEVADSADLTDALLASSQLESCFARHYVRYTFGRVEHIERDGCALESVRTQLADGATLAEVMKGLALRPEFKTRLMTETVE